MTVTYHALFVALSTILGPKSAALELKWMQEAIIRSPGISAPSKLQEMLRRRIKGEPLQYILGTQPFGSLNLLVRPPTLIPRPETEDWTLRLSNLLRPTQAKPITVLDLCTGSGCIPLLLCHLWPAGSTRVVGVDIAGEAIQLARDNAAHCAVPLRDAFEDNPRAQAINTIVLLQDDVLQEKFLSKLATLGCHSFDVITSNPPYISLEEYAKLPSSVKDYEDSRALLGDPRDSIGTRGLTFYHFIAQLLGKHDLINCGGVVALEVGHNQSDEVQKMMINEAQMQRTDVWQDPWGKKRVVIAWK